MDISKLQLPVRSSHRGDGIRYLFSPDPSVNVSYATAQSDLPSPPRVECKKPESVHSEQTLTSDTDDEFNLEFVGSLTETEASQFIRSLQEPKYAKALTGSEISWLYQEFYRQLRSKLEGELSHAGTATTDTDMRSELPLLSREELAAQRRRRRRISRIIEHALDNAEAVVTSSLAPKLIQLSDSNDRDANRLLQKRVDALREHDELRARLYDHLGLDKSVEAQLSPVIPILQDLGEEPTPAGKLGYLVRAHRALADALDTAGGAGADALLPALVAAIVASPLTDLSSNLMYIRRFRRSDALVAHTAYCLTNLDAAIQVLESLIVDDVPEGVDPKLFATATVRSRSRSSSASSRHSNRSSNGALGLLGSLGSGYRNLLSKVGGHIQSEAGVGEPTSPVSPVSPSAAPSIAAGNPRSASTSDSASDGKNSPASSVPAPIEYPTAPVICERFLTSEPDALTLADVRSLLNEYRQLARFVQSDTSLSNNTSQ